jgi:hypothetical protein
MKKKQKKVPLLKKEKHPNHDKLVNDYDNQKSKHLEKLATKMLGNEEKSRALKEKKIKGNFLNLF